MRRSFLPLVIVIASVWGLGCARGQEEKLTPEEQTILDMTNAVRAKENLPPLKVNSTLTRAARAHSENMARQRRMEHKLDGKQPADRAQDAGYKYRRLGENIAYGQGVPVKAIFEGWMNSQGHRENILNPHYTEIGIGRAANAQKEIYYTQVFGTPRP